MRSVCVPSSLMALVIMHHGHGNVHPGVVNFIVHIWSVTLLEITSQNNLNSVLMAACAAQHY